MHSSILQKPPKSKALALIIDLQYDPKVDLNFTPFNPLGFSAAFRKVLDQIGLFKKLGIPFALVRYGNSPFTPGLVAAAGQVPIFSKAASSAFSSPQVSKFVTDLSPSVLVVSGYSVNVCIRSTIEDALKRNLSSWYSADTVFNEGTPNDLGSMQLFVSDLARLRFFSGVLEHANLSQLEESLVSLK